jgi:hypothetical protein
LLALYNKFLQEEIFTSQNSFYHPDKRRCGVEDEVYASVFNFQKYCRPTWNIDIKNKIIIADNEFKPVYTNIK